MVVIDTRTVDRTKLHRVWKTILVGIALVVAMACYFVPALLVAIGVLLLLLLCARLVYQGHDRYIPTLYSRDIRVYDDAYRGLSAARLRICGAQDSRPPTAVGSIAPPEAEPPGFRRITARSRRLDRLVDKGHI